MGGRIPEDVIDDVRQRTDIVDVIGRYVELKRSGSNFKGNCPFHEEKTPSFNVNPARQFYHCFGCQESGDVFGFLMKLEGRTFIDVVEDLASRSGIEIPKQQQSQREIEEEKRRRSDRQQATDLNLRVAKLYRHLLMTDAGSEARSYLANRGIGEEVAEAFQIGFAPPSGDVVARKLRDSGIDMAFADRMGLVAKRRSGQGYHDRFWNRLMFPLMGLGGEVLGFGGRLLGDGDGPKYINTPETALYRKGSSLYGLWQASKAVRQADESIVVEGNFDVLQLHEHGLKNAVAPMGTALTELQAKLLKRFGTRVVAVFDGDDAGRAAANKAIRTFLGAELETKIATLPPGEDPDSLLQREGVDSLRRVINGALPAIDHVISVLRSNMEDSTPGRARVVEQVAPFVRMLPSQVARELYIDRLSYDLNIERGTLHRAVRGQGGSSARRPAAAHAQKERAAGQREPVEQPKELPSREVDLLKMLLAQPTLFPRVQRGELYRLLTNDPLRATYAAAAKMQAESGEIDLPRLLESAPLEVRDAVAEAALCQDYGSATGGDPNRMLDDWLVVTISERLAKARSDTDRRIKNVQQHGQDTRPWVEKMVVLQGLTSRFDRSRRERQLEEAPELVSELIQVERDIHDTH